MKDFVRARRAAELADWKVTRAQLDELAVALLGPRGNIMSPRHGQIDVRLGDAVLAEISRFGHHAEEKAMAMTRDVLLGALRRGAL
jgi:hypothetical protein